MAFIAVPTTAHSCPELSRREIPNDPRAAADYRRSPWPEGENTAQPSLFPPLVVRSWLCYRPKRESTSVKRLSAILSPSLELRDVTMRWTEFDKLQRCTVRRVMLALIFASVLCFAALATMAAISQESHTTTSAGDDAGDGGDGGDSAGSDTTDG